MDTAKLTEYDSIVCIDRSGSMGGPAKGFANRWAAAKELTVGIATLAVVFSCLGMGVIASLINPAKPQVSP